MKLEFPPLFSKNIQILNFMKVHPVGAELFHEARQTDRHTDGETHVKKLIVAFRNFANTHKRNSHHRNYDD